MNQNEIEAVIRNIVAQEVSRNVKPQLDVNTQSGQSNGDISPLLRNLRDSVQKKIKNESSCEESSSSLLENIELIKEEEQQRRR